MTRPELVDEATRSALKRPEVRNLLGMDPLDRETEYQERDQLPGADLTLAGDFTVGVWINVPTDQAGAAGGLVSKFDATSRRGFNLSTVSSAPMYFGPGDELRLSFGIDAGSQPRWTDRGRPAPTSNFTGSLVVFEGALHAASNDGKTKADWAHVYRLAGDDRWEDLGQVSQEGAHGVGPLVVHRGSLFAATWNHDYTRVHTEDLKPSRVYRYAAPGHWEDCGQPGNSRRLFSIASYHGDLYVVGDDFTIHVYRGGTKWELIRKLSTFVHPMSVYDDRLFMATWENPPSVLSFDGANWRDFGNPLGDHSRCSQIHSLVVYDDMLHAGHWPLGRISRWNPRTERWEQLGRLGDSTEINSMAVFNGKLYAGALPRAEVFRYERDGSWTSLRRFRDEPGWHPIKVENLTKAADAPERIRSMGRVTSLSEHDGRLFASVTSCTGAAIDAPLDERGSIFSLEAGVVATTSAVLNPGWHHVAGVRRGSQLALYVDGRQMAEARGSIRGSLASGAPLRIGRDEAASFKGQIHGFVGIDEARSDSDLQKIQYVTKPGGAT